MSLINEALKKAQRLRTDGTPDPAGPDQAGTASPPRRGRADRTGAMVLLGSGALVLVVLSVVVTVYLVNRPAKPDQVALATPPPGGTPAASPEPIVVAPPTPAIVAPTLAPPPQAASAADGLIVPPITSPVPTIASPAASTAPASPVIALPTPAAAQPAPTQVAPPVAVEAVVEAPPPPTLAPDQPDERVTAFVESIRVTGIRSSGAESRVLMNERVYRVNDIVERTLNVRLLNASAENLTFADERGVIYVKRF